MSSLIDFDDGDGDLFGLSNNQSQSSKPSKSVDDIFGTTGEASNSADTLDDIFTPVTQDDIFCEPQKHKIKTTGNVKKQTDELFGENVDDEEDFFGFGKPKTEAYAENKSNAKSVDPFDDFFDGPPSMPSGPQGLTIEFEKADAMTHEESHDSLDNLLDAQPSGTVPANDDLFSIFDRATNPVTPSKPKSGTSKTEEVADTAPLDTVSFKSKEKSQDSLDNLLDAQPSGTVPANDDLFSIFDRATNPVTPSKPKLGTSKTEEVADTAPLDTVSFKSKEKSQDSLDNLLDAQPSGTVPANDDLFSIFDRATNPVTPSKPKSGTSKTKEVADTAPLDTVSFKSKEKSQDSLDNLLDAQPSGTVPANDDLFSIFDRVTNPVTPSKPKSGTSKMEEVADTASLDTVSFKSKEKSQNSLDNLLDAQPSGTVPANDDLFSIFDRATNPVTPSKPKSGTNKTEEVVVTLSSKETSQDSLDNLLDAQPSGTVPANDDLFSIFDRASNPITPSKTKSGTTKPEDVKDTSPLTTTQHKSKAKSDDSLDHLLDAQPSGTVSGNVDIFSMYDRASSQISSSNTKPEVKKEDESVIPKSTQQFPEKKSYGIPQDESNDSLDVLLEAQPAGMVPANDDLMSMFDRAKDMVQDNETTNPVTSSTAKTVIVKDSEKLPEKKSSSPKSKKSKSSRNTVDMSQDESQDSLDVLLGAQPSGTVPTNDDLMSMYDRATNQVTTAKPKMITKERQKDSHSKNPDPLDDADQADVTSTDLVLEGDQQNEAIVEGESERETEEETNNKQKRFKIKKSMERSFDDLLNGLSDESEPELDDMIISDDNDNTNLESLLVTPDRQQPIRKPGLDDFLTPSKPLEISTNMDVMTSTPNAEYQKSDGKVTAPEVKVHTPDDDEDDLKSWEMVDATDGTNQNNSHENKDDHVQMRRRTPSKTSSTDGEGIDLSAIEDTNHLDVDLNKHKSALGKQGSLALRRKPSRKSRKSLLSTGEDAIFQDSTEPKSPTQVNGDEDAFDGKDDENFDMSPPAKKPSPAMMIPLPGMPGRPPSQRLSASSPDDDSEVPREVKRVSKPPPGAFKLPSVMPQPKPRSTEPIIPPKPRAESASPVFGKAALKHVKQADSHVTGSEPRPPSEERDVKFEKPALRSTPKPTRDRDTEEKMDTNNGVFTKPALKSTPKVKQGLDTEQHREQIKGVDLFDTRNLRSRPNESKSKPSGDSQHVFDKPRLRSTGKKSDSFDDDSEKRNIAERESAKTFEKPVLRTTKKDVKSDPFDDTETVGHKFDKPALRSTPAKTNRERDTKPEQTNTGLFDKPTLKRTNASPEKEVKDSVEPKGTFDKPSLRKRDNSKLSEEKGKAAEKPSWLQEAANKQSKVLDALHAKENKSSNNDKPLPSWLEKPLLKKNTRALPLQDTSNNQSEPNDNEKVVKQSTPITRSREPSIGSEVDVDKRKGSSETTVRHDNYSPSWMRQGRSPSTPSALGFTGLSPATSCPTLTDSEEMPQWKKEIAQRKLNRKENSPAEMPKREDSSEPEWKKNVALRKLRPTATPSKEVQHVEPEWKKAAEEKRARLRMSATPGQHDQ